MLDIGGRLASAEGDRLKVALPSDCAPQLKQAIRANKPGLLALLAGPPVIVVRSEILQPELLFWVATDRDRNFLISLGAPSGTVYTREELHTIVERNPDANTLTLLHQSKRIFGGGIFVR